MKFFTLITIGTLFMMTTACGQYSYDESYDDYYEAGEYGEYDPQAPMNNEDWEAIEMSGNGQQLNQQGGNAVNAAWSSAPNRSAAAVPSNGNGEIIMHPITNPQTGMVTGYLPLPSDWKLSGSTWNGPEETVVQEYQGQSFQAYQRRIQSVDQVIREDLLPRLQQSGVQVNNIVDLPEVARNDQAQYAMYWKYAPSQDTHQSKGIEITEASTGTRGLIIVHFTYSRSQMGDMAFYWCHGLSTKAHRYEQDKQTVIYALANYRPNEQAVAAHNRKEQQRAGVSDAAFQQRMAANQANFQASQRASATLSEISDINHQGYMNRSAMNDRGHQNSINSGVWERNAATNPYSGQEVQLEGGYNYYYMNQFGEYFGTNDANYNPQRDQSLGNQEWRPVNPNGGGY